jgi:hypothetical protein
MMGLLFWSLFLLVYVLAVLVAAKAILTVIFMVTAPRVQPAKVRASSRAARLRRAA